MIGTVSFRWHCGQAGAFFDLRRAFASAIPAPQPI